MFNILRKIHVGFGQDFNLKKNYFCLCIICSILNYNKQKDCKDQDELALRLDKPPATISQAYLN